MSPPHSPAHFLEVFTSTLPIHLSCSTLTIIAMPCHRASPCHPAMTHGLPYPLQNTDHTTVNTCHAIQTTNCHAMPTTNCHATSHLPHMPCQPCCKLLYAMPMLTSANLVPSSIAVGCHHTLPSARLGEGASKDILFVLTN